MSKITISYGVDDGYAGKDRPQRLTFDVGNFEEEKSDEDIKGVVWEMIEEDMRQKVSAYWSGRELPEIIAMVRAEYATPAPSDIATGEIG